MTPAEPREREQMTTDTVFAEATKSLDALIFLPLLAAFIGGLLSFFGGF